MSEFIIVEIGERSTAPGCAIGGDKRLLKIGLTHEVIGPGDDGGPVLLAACPDYKTALRVKTALEADANFWNKI